MGNGFGGAGTGKVKNRNLQLREKPEWERRRFLTLVFNLLIVEILFFFFFGGRRREMVEERERVCILFVKGGDLGFGEPDWPLA